MYKLTNVVFKRDDEIIFNNLNLSVNSGDRLILSGYNGIGKTTLLKLLAGVYFANSGEVLFQNEPLLKQAFKNEDFRKNFRKNVALLFQNVDAMLFNPTVYDEIAFTSRKLNLPNVDELVKNAAELCGISDLLDKTPFKLSGGQKQKVAFACVIAHKPKILLLDEPSSNLDFNSIIALGNILNQLKDTTIIAVSHDNQFNELFGADIVDFESLR